MAPDGAIDWLCVPSFDSPSIFGTLLDRGAGVFRLGPFGFNVPTARFYEPGTNTVSTTWNTPTGWILVRDALTMGPSRGEDEITPHTRPPADDDADHVLVRTVLCLEGDVEIELVCEPAFDYGRAPAEWTMEGGDRHTADATGAGQTVRLRTDMAIGIEGDRVRARHVVKQGDQVYCSLSWSEELDSPQDIDEANARMAATQRFWRGWLGRARNIDHRWRQPIQRSALAIKGLTYMPTGATVAALTTSLPETPGGERNWDYRYTWMRDSTFTLQALHWLQLDWEADEFMQFVADLEANEDGALQIMYGIDGRRDLTESTRDELFGYMGASPVRIGNGAFDQRQNDVFGAVLDSILLHTRRSQRLPRRLWPIVQSQAECATAVWRNPDQGIWEARGAPQHYVSSKLMCWVALDRAAKLAEIRGGPELGATWRATAEEIKADILEHGVKDGVLRQHYDTDALDASTLLAAIFGFLPGDDERLRKSVDAIADDLTEDGFVLRYRTGETDDGLSGKEGSFLICSFWLVSALAIVGEDQRARDLMEKLLAVASPLGLYAEEFDTSTGAAPGELPSGLLAPGPDRGRGADHPRRAPEGVDGMSSYDVIVIGSGAGGGTLVHRLASSGKRILLLERGDWLPREPRTGARRTCSWTTGTSRPDTWYDADTAKAFQPQIHYFVGGATKLYGAALYRLRAEDFGELRHHDGISPAWPIGYDEMEPYYTQAEQLYQVHGARGEDPTEPPASAPYPFPAVSHEPRIQQLSDDLAAEGLHPFHAPCGVMLNEDDMPYSNCVRCATCDGFPCLVHAKSDAEVLAVRPALEHANVTLHDGRAGRGARHQPGGHGGHRGGGRARRCSARPTPPTSWWCPAGRPTRPSCCSPRPATSIPTAWPTGPTRWAATTRSTTARRCWRCRRKRTRRSSRRRSGSTTSTSAATTSSSRWGTSRWSASRRRRCTAARSRSRPSSRPRGRSRAWPATRWTSGSPPRTCPAPTTGSRSTGTGASGSATRRPTTSPRSASSTSSSRCSGTSGCTTSTSSRVTRT